LGLISTIWRHPPPFCPVSTVNKFNCWISNVLNFNDSTIQKVEKFQPGTFLMIKLKVFSLKTYEKGISFLKPFFIKSSLMKSGKFFYSLLRWDINQSPMQLLCWSRLEFWEYHLLEFPFWIQYEFYISDEQYDLVNFNSTVANGGIMENALFDKKIDEFFSYWAAESSLP